MQANIPVTSTNAVITELIKVCVLEIPFEHNMLYKESSTCCGAVPLIHFTPLYRTGRLRRDKLLFRYWRDCEGGLGRDVHDSSREARLVDIRISIFLPACIMLLFRNPVPNRHGMRENKKCIWGKRKRVHSLHGLL